MNRRDLFKLVGAAGIAVQSVETLELKPKDTIVIKVKGYIKTKDAVYIKTLMEEKFPGHKCLVLDDDTEIKVIRNA